MKTVYINDFLSKQSLEVFHHAKSLKTIGYKFVYSRDGNIFAKKDEKSKQIKIKSMEDVDKILLAASGGLLRKNRTVIVPAETSEDDDDGDDDEN